MREFGPKARALREQLEARLALHEQTAEHVIRAEQQAEASAQVSFANTITSLHLCASQDWTRNVERVSLVEQILQRDPAGVYGRMDFASRDRYRQALEEIAETSGEAQVAAALAATEAARAAHEQRPEDPAAHVGFHLIGKGRPALARVGFRAARLARVRRAVFRHATLSYLGALTLVCGGAVAAAVLAARAQGAPPTLQVLVGLLALLPASDLATGLVQRLAAALAKPRHLPRLDLSGGVPENAEAMVVVPTRLTRQRDRSTCSSAWGAGARQPRPARPLRDPPPTSATPHRDTPGGDAPGAPKPRCGGSRSSTGATAARASSCSIGCGALQPERGAAGWAGSASAARSRSS
jgi:cyclic beta-1,2-glucan synthetase